MPSNSLFGISARAGVLSAIFLLLLLVLIGCGGASHGFAGGSSANVPAVDHVFLVVLENHSFSTVIGSPSMPYFNSLATQHSLATNYFANVHSSLPNYFMLTVGLPETFDDSFSETVNDDNIVRALTASSKTWKAYIESLPSVGYTGGDVAPLYLKQHNPFAFLSDVAGSGMQMANLVPFNQLSADLSTGSLPSFGFILPNPEDDAHTCPGAAAFCADSDMLAAADTWLKNNIDPLIHSPAFGNSVLIITWDEGAQTDLTNGGGQVATVLVGSHVKTGFKSTTFYQHQSTLRVILDLLRVSDLPNAAASATTMGEFFQ